jgi:hypothetical protein
MWISLGSRSFWVGGPSSSARSGGAASSTRCMVPQPFAAGGNRPYLELWVVTGGPWYPRYKTLREREREREVVLMGGRA